MAANWAEEHFETQRKKSVTESCQPFWKAVTKDNQAEPESTPAITNRKKGVQALPSAEIWSQKEYLTERRNNNYQKIDEPVRKPSEPFAAEQHLVKERRNPIENEGDTGQNQQKFSMRKA